MDKVFEALEEIGNIDLGDNPYKKFEDNKLKNVYNKEFAILYNAIAELKAIKEAEPSEALRKLDDISYLVLNEIDDLKNKELWKSYFNTIKQALLKQLSGSQYTNIVLDEAVKPSEAMEALQKLDEMEFHISEKVYVEELNDYVNETQYLSNTVAFSTIKQYILKTQELEKENAELKACIRDWEDDYEHLKYAWEKRGKVLEIIKEKDVDIKSLKLAENWLDYYTIVKHKTGKNTELTQEEFDLLKRYSK